MKMKSKGRLCRWVFVLPALLVVGILLIYPIFSSLYYSMTTKHLIRLTYDFIGLEKIIKSSVGRSETFFKSIFKFRFCGH